MLFHAAAVAEHCGTMWSRHVNRAICARPTNFRSAREFTRCEGRRNREHMSFNETAERSRPTIFTKVGATFYIGIPNSNPPDPAYYRLMFMHDFSWRLGCAQRIERAQPIAMPHQPSAKIVARVVGRVFLFFWVRLGLGSHRRFAVFHNVHLQGGTDYHSAFRASGQRCRKWGSVSV